MSSHFRVARSISDIAWATVSLSAAKSTKETDHSWTQVRIGPKLNEDRRSLLLQGIAHSRISIVLALTPLGARGDRKGGVALHRMHGTRSAATHTAQWRLQNRLKEGDANNNVSHDHELVVFQ